MIADESIAVADECRVAAGVAAAGVVAVVVLEFLVVSASRGHL